MSLRSFHIFFIFLATVFSLWFAMWSGRAYGNTGAVMDLALCIVSAVSALGLSIYFVWFIQKTRSFKLFSAAFSAFLVGTLVNPTVATACAVCFADADAPMTKGANAGILFLLAVISTVLVAIGGYFIVWIRRAKKLGH